MLWDRFAFTPFVGVKGRKTLSSSDFSGSLKYGFTVSDLLKDCLTGIVGSDITDKLVAGSDEELLLSLLASPDLRRQVGETGNMLDEG